MPSASTGYLVVLFIDSEDGGNIFSSKPQIVFGITTQNTVPLKELFVCNRPIRMSLPKKYSNFNSKNRLITHSCLIIGCQIVFHKAHCFTTSSRKRIHRKAFILLTLSIFPPYSFPALRVTELYVERPLCNAISHQ